MRARSKPWARSWALAFFVVLFLNPVNSWGQAPLLLSQMSPARGSAGAPVTITGEKFGATQGSSAVRFGAVPATVRRWSDSSLVVEVPAAAKPGSVDVLITIAGVKEEHPGSFTVLETNHLSPTEGAAGTLVSISGSGFGDTQGMGRVYFGKTPVTVIRRWSDPQIVFVAPDADTDPGSKIEVTFRKGGVAKREGVFTIVAAMAKPLDATANPQVDPPATEPTGYPIQPAQKAASANEPVKRTTASAPTARAQGDKQANAALAAADPPPADMPRQGVPPIKPDEVISKPADPTPQQRGQSAPAGQQPPENAPAAPAAPSKTGLVINPVHEGDTEVDASGATPSRTYGLFYWAIG
jgi:hypothetical protein